MQENGVSGLVMESEQSMLEFEGKWRFDSPGSIEIEVVWAFRELIDTICGQGRRKAILEHFKSHFASAAGSSTRH